MPLPSRSTLLCGLHHASLQESVVRFGCSFSLIVLSKTKFQLSCFNLALYTDSYHGHGRTMNLITYELRCELMDIRVDGKYYKTSSGSCVALVRLSGQTVNTISSQNTSTVTSFLARNSVRHLHTHSLMYSVA